jgi:RNA polymerase sigma-70 factor (ECF subfamily)
LELTDLECLERARKGDAEGFRALVDRHAAALHRVAYGLLGNPADADDVVQEAFLGAIAGMKRFDGRSSVKTWLTRIVVNQSALWRRRRGRRRTDLPIEVADASPSGATASHADRADARFDVATMLASLSIEHRQVIVLRELQQLSYEEIAAVLNVPRGTVESRLHRARESLREKFPGFAT